MLWSVPERVVERVGEQAIEPAPLRVEALLARDAVDLRAELIGGRRPGKGSVRVRVRVKARVKARVRVRVRVSVKVRVKVGAWLSSK